MNQTVIGLLHPGEMGAAVGKCLTGRGHTVVWASKDRSEQTRARAEAAGLTDGQTIPAACGTGLLLSVCPPQAAEDVALECRDMDGIYVDANAVSVATARRVAAVVEAAGASYVDGGIIGPPPDAAGRTRLYLSGERAAEVRALFARSALDARIADGPAYAASAVKMAYAAWTKGTSALLLACRALARSEGVEKTLLAEWGMSQPALGAQSERSAAAAAAKGWRWVAEMEEIAASMAAAGLPTGFHDAAAGIYDRAARADGPGTRVTQTDSPPTLDTVVSALT